MGGEYNVGVSGPSSSTSLATNFDSPLNVTGGGGSSASSTGAGSPISSTGTATGFAAYLPWILGGLVLVALGAIYFLKR